MAKRGRSSKLSPEVTERICASLRNGDDWDVAARLAGIDPSTLHRWRARGRESSKGVYREFYDTVERARAEAIARNNFIVQQAGLGVEREKTVTRTYMQNGQLVTETTVTREREFDWRAAAYWLDKHVHGPQMVKAAQARGAGADDVPRTPEDFAREIKRALDAMDQVSGGYGDSDEATQENATSADGQ